MPVPRRSTILCVDDEEVALAMRGKVLEAAGYVVLEAGTASQALDLFKNHRVELVISDHLLPGTTGKRFSPRTENAQTEATYSDPLRRSDAKQ
jgi:two-component system, OmpR family, response regulator CpxR